MILPTMVASSSVRSYSQERDFLMPAVPSVPARPEEERTKSSPSPRLLTLDDIAPPPSTFTSDSFMAQNTLPSESAGLEPLTPQRAHGPSEGGITPAQRDHMESIR